MIAPLPEDFFQPSARVVAPKLLGHWLIRNTHAGQCGGLIVEVEAYLSDDPACHAYGGETARNRSMWGSPGRAYVYLIYGYHFCVNAVCRPRGTAEAVLIRALDPALGEDWLLKNRSVKSRVDLANGPAKLCAAMKITRELDGVNLCDASSPLFVGINPEIDHFREAHGPIATSKRVGISKAAHLPLRYFLAGSAFVSRASVKRRNSQ